jgi:hypothetical protein
MKHTPHKYLPHTPPLCGAVPPSILKLVRALRGAEGDPPGDLLQESRLVATNLCQTSASTTILLADHSGVQDDCTARRPGTKILIRTHVRLNGISIIICFMMTMIMVWFKNSSTIICLDILKILHLHFGIYLF